MAQNPSPFWEITQPLGIDAIRYFFTMRSMESHRTHLSAAKCPLSAYIYLL
ncbi:hypothetical protein [Paenibacillus sp. sgz500958]|uniref:hypothetical protein n=1 Tax=Paenibacillus sp. sgz500958 TaxID=3242475 RepID=UPI0036D36948